MRLTTPNGSEMEVLDNGEVHWILSSGMRRDSTIRIPTAEDTLNAKGVADGLRVLADYIETRRGTA